MLPSRTFGRYILIEQLGRGGMATVFRARDPEFDRDVALKVLPEELLQDPEFRARFQREARAIARLEHPAIVPVYDIGEEQGQPFLVMRFMPGGTLGQRLAKGPLPPAECVALLGRMGSALDEAHRHGMVHRDIKPGNILFDSYDKPHLADFGIVKLSQAATTLTGTGMIGTPAYMSPEQSEGRSDVGPATDIYALGVVLFQMLTGCLPYEADTPVGLALKHIKEPVPRLREFNPKVPAALQAVIDRAMAKKPEDRFPTAGDLAQALEAVVSPTRPAAAVSRETLRESKRRKVAAPSPKPPAPEIRTLRAPRPRRSRLPVVLVAAAL
ncbi:MAG: serine/threonine protein kinase, partial [Thermoleophilia bacterium]|nr:serine/threonine protein kinase [Thermoleophilia bacterium]